jgi:hypothetical protein
VSIAPQFANTQKSVKSGLLLGAIDAAGTDGDAVLKQRRYFAVVLDGNRHVNSIEPELQGTDQEQLQDKPARG